MNKRTTKQGFLLLMLTLGLPLFYSVQGHAHAVHGETENSSEALCASASYEDGEAMSYAAVEILAPNSKLPFQSGRTDRNGYFCFRPDTPGRWRITVKDEDGHFVRLGAKVSKEMLDHQKTAISAEGHQKNSVSRQSAPAASDSQGHRQNQ